MIPKPQLKSWLRRSTETTSATPAVLAAVVITVILLLCGGCHRKTPSAPVPAAVSPVSAEERWKEAAAKVEEPRQGQVGLRAHVNVPDELKHEGNPHRFLALQAAEFRKQAFELPDDFAGLSALIEKGELVEMPMTGDDYVLFGVGGIAKDGPLTYYDPDTRVSIPIFSSDEQLQAAKQTLDTDATNLRGEIANLKREIAATTRRDRLTRAMLGKEINSKQSSLDSNLDRQQTLAAYYGDARHQQIISGEYKTLSALASNFDGTTYNLDDPAGRLAFKIRLLSFIRPAAKAILEEIASGYHSQFGRPLPVTSLVRTDEYQHDLSETNPNAARNTTPPHTTGLAFDIYYHFMDADEQTFLMNKLAELKQAGKIEALKETRDHFHVFVFAGGQPPPEDLVAESISELAKPRERDGAAKRQPALAGKTRRPRGRRA